MKMNKKKRIHHTKEDWMYIYQCTDARWDGVINYSSALIPVIVLFRNPDDGTNKMRMQKYYIIKGSE